MDDAAEDRRDERRLADLAGYERRKAESNALTRYIHGFPPPPGTTLAEQERWAIDHAMELCQGNRIRAARMLGIDRTTLWRKLKQQGLG